MTHAYAEELLVTLKRAGSVLKATGVPFALGGGFAAYAHGGASSDHDVDFLIRHEDLGTILPALSEAGFRIEQPPEDWLVKAMGTVLAVVGGTLVCGSVRRRVTPELALLANGVGLGLAALEAIYTRSGRIRGVYALDALLEVVFAGAWMATGRSPHPQDQTRAVPPN